MGGQVQGMGPLEAVDPKAEAHADAAGEGGPLDEGRGIRRSGRRANQDAAPGIE